MTSLEDAIPLPEREPNTVIVVGGGLAGLSATIEAARNGAKVYLLEKESRLGGNSAKATSGINGWGTDAQKVKKIEDSSALFETDTFRSGKGGYSDYNLVKTLSLKSNEALTWLGSFGVPLSELFQLGGHSRKRTHRTPDTPDGKPLPIGFTTISALQKYIIENLSDRVEIIKNAKVEKLTHKITSSQLHQVNGVEYRTNDSGNTRLSLKADAVILATGGFSNDHTSRSLLQEHAPHLASFPTTNGPWATGDGVKMARELGVALVDMDKVQLHPTGLIDPKDPANLTKYLGPEALRGSGGILVNKKGERFVNELELRSVVSQAIIAQNDIFPNSNGSTFAHCILNEEAAKLFGINSLTFYWKRLGLFVKVEDVAGLAKLIGCSEDAIKETLEHYATVSSGSRACPMTGKSVFPCKLGPQGPFYVAYVTPSIHYTMGGCLISPSGEMQRADETETGAEHRRPILGLFGAGEVTGGVHGKNRLGGNSLLECVVFGRIAGKRASLFDSTDVKSVMQLEKEAFLDVTEIILHKKCENEIVVGGKEVVLSFSSASYVSGLNVLQPVKVLSERSGESIALYPSSSTQEQGNIRFFIPFLLPHSHEWLHSLELLSSVKVVPGDKVDTGDLRNAKEISVVLTSESGISLLVQLVRAPLQLTKISILYDMSIYSGEKALLHFLWFLEFLTKEKRPEVSLRFFHTAEAIAAKTQQSHKSLHSFLSPSEFSSKPEVGKSSLCLFAGDASDKNEDEAVKLLKKTFKEIVYFLH